jgi:hypothetical protein
MNASSLVNFYASHGFLLDQTAISYLQTHDSEEILELFVELNPEVLVIDLPAIRKVQKTKRTNVVTVRVQGFRQESSWRVIKDSETRGRKLLLNALEEVERKHLLKVLDAMETDL